MEIYRAKFTWAEILNLVAYIMMIKGYIAYTKLYQLIHKVIKKYLCILQDLQAPRITDKFAIPTSDLCAVFFRKFAAELRT